MPRRPVLFATLAVVLVGAAGATSVFLLGSKQRRDDRAAYLAYERAVLVQLAARERIDREMILSLGSLRDGTISAVEASRRARGWLDALAAVRAGVVVLRPPAFLGDIERRWIAAIDLSTRIPGLVERAAHASGQSRAALVTAAETAAVRAGDSVDRAAERMQFHRRRLGLGPTPALPDPAATRTG